MLFLSERILTAENSSHVSFLARWSTMRRCCPLPYPSQSRNALVATNLMDVVNLVIPPPLPGSGGRIFVFGFKPFSSIQTHSRGRTGRWQCSWAGTNGRRPGKPSWSSETWHASARKRLGQTSLTSKGHQHRGRGRGRWGDGVGRWEIKVEEDKRRDQYTLVRHRWVGVSQWLCYLSATPISGRAVTQATSPSRRTDAVPPPTLHHRTLQCWDKSGCWKPMPLLTLFKSCWI